MEKIYKAEEKNNPASHLNRRKLKEMQVCKWLNVRVTENSVSQ